MAVKLAFVADVHIGNHRRFGGPVTRGMNLRCSQALDTLRRARAEANNLEVDGFFVLGDLFDSVRPEPQVIAATIDALNTGCKDNSWCLVGNHDQSSTSRDDNALAPLARTNTIAVDEKPAVYFLPHGIDPRVSVWAVPYHPGQARDWLLAGLQECSKSDNAKRARGPRVLLTHVGISDDKTPSFLRGVHDSVHIETMRHFCNQFGIDYVFAGNWHEHRAWKYKDGDRPVEIYQVGTLVPTGWDNPGFDNVGTMIVLTIDDKCSVRVGTVPGPRFVVVRTTRELRALLTKHSSEGHNIYVRWIVNEAHEVAGANQILQDAKLAEPTGLLYDGVVELDEHTAEEQARTAAKAAESSETLASALASFVEAMPLPVNVTPEEVLARARVYLTRAK